MVRIGCPADIDRFYMTDDPDVIFRLHQANCPPAWMDDECVYFKKNSKLRKVLKKIGIELPENDEL